MRSEKEIINLILSTAKADDRIRVVILNGSRTNPCVKKDEFQDFDVIYLVRDLSTFEEDPNWIDIFGERMIMQMPHSMQLEDVESEGAEAITYLMLFKDLNRIDLNLIDIKNKASCTDSLNKVLLDKDKLFGTLPEPNEKDYWVRPPSQKAFTDYNNEFWWVSTYVVKGLARAEPLYAKDMLEGPVRSMFMKMLAWYVGSKTGFTINPGKSNRFIKNYVSPIMWESILKTYPDADLKNIWDSLVEMTQLFHELALAVADKNGLQYNLREAENVKDYIQQLQFKYQPNEES